MNLRQLELFVRVAEDGGFSAAGRHANIAQSAVSKQISNLEAELGILLFKRMGRSTVLTNSGKDILSDARDILERVDRLKRTARGSTDVSSVIVGSSHSFGNYMFPRLSVALSQKTRRIAVGYSQGTTNRLIDLMAEGELDIAILTTLATDAPNFAKVVCEPLCDEQLFVVGRPDVVGPSTSLSPTAAFAKPLVMLPKETLERKSYALLANELGQELKVEAEAENLTLMMALARTGVGCALVPATGLPPLDSNSDLAFAAIDGVYIRRWISVRMGASRDRAVARVLSTIRDMIDGSTLAPGVEPCREGVSP